MSRRTRATEGARPLKRSVQQSLPKTREARDALNAAAVSGQEAATYKDPCPQGSEIIIVPVCTPEPVIRLYGVCSSYVRSHQLL